MTTISVLAPPDAKSGYRAVSAGVEATGDTPGQAIDALVEQTGANGATLVVIQPKAGDEFFSDEQRVRLADLMARWRAARDSGTPFPPDDQAALDSLIAEELKAAVARSAAMLKAVRP